MRPSLFVVLVLAIAGPAHADPSDKDKELAARLFKEGREAITAGKVDEACTKFEQSFKLDPAIGTKLNVADCLERKGLLAAAYRLFDEAAAEAAKTSKEGRESFARQRANALAARLVKVQLRLASELPGMTITVDGVVVAEGEWGQPRFLSPGSFTVDAAAPGHVAFHQDIDSHAGDVMTIDVPALAVTPPTTPVGDGTTGPPATGTGVTRIEPRHRRSHRTAYLVAGGGGVLLGASLGLGLAARSAFKGAACGSHAEPPLPDGMCTPAGQSTTNRARREADIGTGLAIGGLAAVAVGAILYFRSGSGQSDHAVLVSPAVSDGTVGVVVTFQP